MQPGPHPDLEVRSPSFGTAPLLGGAEVWAGWSEGPAGVVPVDGHPANVTATIMARMTQRRPRVRRENFGTLIFQAPLTLVNQQSR